MRRILKAIRWPLSAVGVSSALLAASLVTPGPASASTVAPQRNFMDFNYCGAVCQQGKFDLTKVGSFISKIQSFQPSVLLLQEICKNQLDDLINAAPTWTFSGVLLSVKDPNRTACLNSGTDTRFGNAILTHQALTNTHEEVLPQGTGQTADAT